MLPVSVLIVLYCALGDLNPSPSFSPKKIEAHRWASGADVLKASHEYDNKKFEKH